MIETRFARLLAAACAALTVAAPGGAPAWAFSAGDAARGHEFALERCAGCHEVPGGAPARVAPAFAVLAGDEDAYTLEVLAEAIKRPHWGQRRVSRGDAADVAAYIAAMRADLAAQAGAEPAGNDR